MLGLGEAGVGRLLVAELGHRRNVAGRVRPDLRCVLRGGRLDRHHRGQLFVLDRDLLGSIHGLQPRLRNDSGNRFADEAHLAHRQRIVGRRRHGLAIRIHQADEGREGAHAVGLQVGAGEDGDDPRHGLGRSGVD